MLVIFIYIIYISYNIMGDKDIHEKLADLSNRFKAAHGGKSLKHEYTTLYTRLNITKKELIDNVDKIQNGFTKLVNSNYPNPWGVTEKDNKKNKIEMSLEIVINREKSTIGGEPLPE